MLRWLMSGSKDRSVVFWDPRSSRAMLTLTGYRNSVISVAPSPSSPYFATGSGDCLAVVWKYQLQSI
jgi:general transcriptional corepressor TUP1